MICCFPIKGAGWAMWQHPNGCSQVTKCIIVHQRGTILLSALFSCSLQFLLIFANSFICPCSKARPKTHLRLLRDKQTCLTNHHFPLEKKYKKRNHTLENTCLFIPLLQHVSHPYISPRIEPFYCNNIFCHIMF
jgi:hypothetical protein